MSRLSLGLHVARADGPGAGRFVAAALADALEAGNALLGIQSSPVRPDIGDHALDFIFSCDPQDEEEVIRVGLDRHDSVVSAELLRRPRTGLMALGVGEAGAPEVLLSALQSGNAVAELRWDGHSDSRAATLLVTMRRDCLFRIPIEPS